MNKLILLAICTLSVADGFKPVPLYNSTELTLIKLELNQIRQEQRQDKVIYQIKENEAQLQDIVDKQRRMNQTKELY